MNTSDDCYWIVCSAAVLISPQFMISTFFFGCPLFAAFPQYSIWLRTGCPSTSCPNPTYLSSKLKRDVSWFSKIDSYNEQSIKVIKKLELFVSGPLFNIAKTPALSNWTFLFSSWKVGP